MKAVRHFAAQPPNQARDYWKPDRESLMSTQRRFSRRRLLGRAVGTAAAGFALPHIIGCSPGTAPAGRRSVRVSPNDQIDVGIIGCGRRNGQLVIGKGGQGAPPPHARIVAVADFNLKLRADQWAQELPRQGVPGLPRAAGPQGRGRGHLCHARALALPALHPCLPGGQGHLRRAAA